MICEKIQDAFNNQLNAELYSAYLYMSMSADFEDKNLKGFAAWMRVQAMEEFAHADKFYRFIIDRGGKVKLTAIDGPETEWATSLAVFEAVYAHERKVTGLIDDLVDLAASQRDHAAGIFLQWFVTEQVEEEASASGIVRKLQLIGESGNALLMLDRELGARVSTPPAAEGA